MLVLGGFLDQVLKRSGREERERSWLAPCLVCVHQGGRGSAAASLGALFLQTEWEAAWPADLKIAVMLPSYCRVEKLHGLDFCGWLQVRVQAVPKQLHGIGGEFLTWAIA